MTRTRMPDLAILFVLTWMCLPVSSAGSQPQVGGAFPAVVLDVPKDPALKSYLGLKADGKFRIPMIATEVVIVQVFSMY